MISFQNFETHVRDFYDSPQFKQKAKEAEPFLAELKPFLFGIPNTLENIVRSYLSCAMRSHLIPLTVERKPPWQLVNTLQESLFNI